MDFKKIRSEATNVADAQDADVFFYNGDISSQYEAEFARLGDGQLRRKNVLLVLCTRGGVPDAAYRMGRFLQLNYEKFTLLVCGKCKSSGTLIALGAHEIVMTDRAELGPLDIQLGKKDELFENDSGLTVLNAITELEGKAYDLFESGFVRLKYRTEGRMTMRTATGLASELAIGMISPIMSQIDPMHVGEVSRAMKVAKEYGERLTKRSRNAQEGTLDRLINSYPSHGFVIDRDEAKELFTNVRSPNSVESGLIAALGNNLPVNPLSDAVTFVVSHPKKEATNANDHQQAVDNPNPNAPEAGDQPAAGGTAVGDAGGGNVTPIDAAKAA